MTDDLVTRLRDSSRYDSRLLMREAAADRPAPARQAGELTLARPINHTAVIIPLESPIRSTPPTPMRSTMLRNKLLIGWPPNFR